MEGWVPGQENHPRLVSGRAPPGRERGLGARIGRPSAPLKRAGRTSVRSPARLLVPVEVARRLLLEPQAVVLRRLLEEVRRLLEHVVAWTRLGRRRGGLRLRFRPRLGLRLGVREVLDQPRILLVAGPRPG